MFHYDTSRRASDARRPANSRSITQSLLFLSLPGGSRQGNIACLEGCIPYGSKSTICFTVVKCAQKEGATSSKSRSTFKFGNSRYNNEGRPRYTGSLHNHMVNLVSDEIEICTLRKLHVATETVILILNQW